MRIINNTSDIVNSRLQIRQRALIEQGLLKDPKDLPKFAQDL